MPRTPFYKQHWVDIDEERLERYQRMFTWNPASGHLYDLADIQESHLVAEFGCGPGHTAVEIAKWVGRDGHVHAWDINEEFIAQSARNAEEAGLSGRITPCRCDGTKVPLDSDTLDRVTTRNTLIYVDEPTTTLGEFHRVLKPGGKMHAIEGDWPMMVAEPLPPELWNALLAAASQACRTPDIGRKLAGLAADAGFRDVTLEIFARPDLEGRLLPMIRTLGGYARDSGRIDATEVDRAILLLEEALAAKRYLVLAPQFVVAATK